MAAAAFCYMTHRHGVNNLNQLLPHTHTVNRIDHVLSLPDVGLRPSNSKIYLNKAITTRTSHSTQRQHRILLKCAVQQYSEEAKEEHISKATLIWRAIKLPMYTVALIPITVGSAAAYFETGQYFANRFLRLFVSSACIIAWVNLSNDVYDFDTGADINKKESVVNLVGSRTWTHVLAWILLALGFIGLSWVSVEASSLRPILLLSYAIVCGYVYQCPPFRLSYMGLGEPLCFAAFGPFATIAFYLLQSGTKVLSISGAVVASSILVGLTTSLILFCSHFHQIEDDKAVGKFSPLVRLGTERGAKVVKLTVVVLYMLVFILGLCQTLPFSSVILCALTLPVGNLVVSFVDNYHKDKTKIFMAKYYCVRLHTVFGAALAAGLVAARMFARKQLPQAILL
ncbi:2-carboxy-1,4-naphthoquinone phytyltransferase, chloroplastic isoform X2 [Salvia miltiorrhiza]|uniref:2-carboxy-1,4-naphthoquinone phytyltransferase, chloroplastic isoform X2 n=1 Tax=Salvia miltiorrhiza TaxID=226208 RepID=UPI0025ABAE8A|nr:2-carboxy-1,4-naphthoquinone phytyltransferase, chloroplastic isoform X2 [Salvia miltiorrhiza]